ncbi:MAG: MFS transporter [Negativicutes bacterium]|nr:MFS transporter [Negativicutes bacterium]
MNFPKPLTFWQLLRNKNTDGPDAQFQRNQQINVAQGILSIMAINLVNPFLNIFAIKNGATDYQVALLASAPALVSVLSMIPGARYIDKHAKKHKVTLLTMLFHRCFYLFLACIPFFRPNLRASLLVATIALMNLPGSISTISWQSYIARVIPPALRPQSIATRNKMQNLVGTCFTLLAGRFLDIASYPIGYQLAFFTSFLLAMVEIWVFSRMDEPDLPGDEAIEQRAQTVPAKTSPVQSLKKILREIWQEKRFLRFCAASLCFNFAMMIPWSLFSLYQVRILGANNTWVSLLSLINTGGSLLGYGFWTRYSQKNGNLATLFSSGIWIFVVPLAYAFSKSLYFVACINLITGMVFSGVNLSLFNATLEAAPEKNRTSFLAYHQTVINIMAVFAPIVGVGLRDLFGFQIAFLICALLRIGGASSFKVLQRYEKKHAAEEIV